MIQTFPNTGYETLQKRVIPKITENLGKQTRPDRKAVAVFDLDGTLLVGKTPCVSLIKFFNNLPFDCVIVTARSSHYHEATVNQLHKHGIQYHELITMPDDIDRNKKGAVAEFKAGCRDRISERRHIALSVGDKWSDIHQVDDGLIDDYPSNHDRYFVGPNFVKLPEYMHRFVHKRSTRPASISSHPLQAESPVE